MKLTFIGTSHGVPEPDRRTSSYLLEINGKYYIIDMGTQTVEDLRRRCISVDDVRLVICTHPHGDHTNGVISFADLCSWFFRSADPAILLPSPKLIDALKAWIEATGTAFRTNLRLSTYQAGVAYRDENLTVTAIENRHCPYSYSLLIEAEGRSILFTGDLHHPTDDFPTVAFERDIDLIVCEAAHFSPLDCIPVFDRTRARRIIHAHICPWNWGRDLYAAEKDPHPYIYGHASDGMEICL